MLGEKSWGVKGGEGGGGVGGVKGWGGGGVRGWLDLTSKRFLSSVLFNIRESESTFKQSNTSNLNPLLNNQILRT